MSLITLMWLYWHCISVILQHYPYIGPEARECTQCSTSRTRSDLLAEVFASNRLDMSKQYMYSTLFQYEVVDDLVLYYKYLAIDRECLCSILYLHNIKWASIPQCKWCTSKYMQWYSWQKTIMNSKEYWVIIWTLT